MMGVLKAKQRNALPESEFGMPGARKYPMPDASHAANAISRATQQVNAGNLSPGTAATIKSKARGIINRARGGG